MSFEDIFVENRLNRLLGAIKKSDLSPRTAYESSKLIMDGINNLRRRIEGLQYKVPAQQDTLYQLIAEEALIVISPELSKAGVSPVQRRTLNRAFYDAMRSSQ